MKKNIKIFMIIGAVLIIIIASLAFSNLGSLSQGRLSLQINRFISRNIIALPDFAIQSETFIPSNTSGYQRLTINFSNIAPVPTTANMSVTIDGKEVAPMYAMDKVKDTTSYISNDFLLSELCANYPNGGGPTITLTLDKDNLIQETNENNNSMTFKSNACVSSNSAFSSVSVGNVLKANNGISVKLVGIYNDTDPSKKIIELNFYIGSQRLNISRNFYSLSTNKNGAGKLVLEDFGVKITVDPSSASMNSISMQVESKITKNFVNGNDLYNECLKNPPQTPEGLSTYPLAFICAKYSTNITTTEPGYKVMSSYGFTVIAKNSFSDSQMKSFLNLITKAYQQMQNHLQYSSITPYTPIIFMDDDLNHASITMNWGIAIRAQNWGTFDNVHSTDVTHELVHWFDRFTVKSNDMEEGYAMYNDLLRKQADGLNVYVKCNETTIEDNMGGSDYITTYTKDNYAEGMCFWKELHDKALSLYNTVNQYIVDNRTPTGVAPLSISQMLKNGLDSETFQTFSTKYLQNMANSSGEDINNITISPISGDPMKIYW